jgi:hypothetical protein
MINNEDISDGAELSPVLNEDKKFFGNPPELLQDVMFCNNFLALFPI